ncbi:uncharacterized protein F4822DRAFT_57322 [Hypoxylon trugodes]|uniref:uncharacterized protein n=1 Tax=Hypoxylon trugodes TaxID=326681 RepID=UPI0021982239|nr:uncharacterized protein F4822DRAFT_57322 [Hypoxylon trugodes]KAI1383976.1 hypothetical protein F4822DRAFT_57322 [Hypoxylon trugodes]
MAFEFVNNTTIDRNARRLIRSHAAKGKNVGKTHPSRRRRAAMKAKTTKPDNKTTELISRHESAVVSTTHSQLDYSLFAYSLPIELPPGSGTLVQKVFSFLSGVPYTDGLGNVVDFAQAGSIWIEFLFLDEAYFHCSIAMCLAAVDSLIVTREESVEAMHHVSSSLRLVKERLSGEKALADTTMATVVAMIQYERLCGQYYQALVHFEGLQEMVRLRGRIAHLRKSKPALVQKIFRVDLELSLYLGPSTRFKADEVPGATAIDWLRKGFGEPQIRHLLKSYPLTQLNPQLQDVFIDIMSLAWFLNGNVGDGTRLDGYTYHNILILIGYRLIHLRSLDGPPLADRLENAIHIGLLMFMTTFLLSLSHKLPNVPLLRELVRALVQEEFDEDAGSEDVLLWVLFIGKISIFKGREDAWLVQRASRIMSTLDLRNWDDVCQVISKFPFVCSLHGSSGQSFWNQLNHI